MEQEDTVFLFSRPTRSQHQIGSFNPGADPDVLPHPLPRVFLRTSGEPGGWLCRCRQTCSSVSIFHVPLWKCGESSVETRTRFHELWKSPQASKHPPVDKKVLAL